MFAVKVYDPAMQPAVEACFKECVEALGWAYQPNGRHGDIIAIQETYMRHGCFWCLFEDGVLAGMVAVHTIDEEYNIAEMKRLYVLPQYQGKGYGGILFGHAIDYAKARGYAALRLDTRRDRAATLHLIKKYRLRQIEKYNDNAFSELYFELRLE